MPQKDPYAYTKTEQKLFDLNAEIEKQKLAASKIKEPKKRIQAQKDIIEKRNKFFDDISICIADQIVEELNRLEHDKIITKEQKNELFLKLQNETQRLIEEDDKTPLPLTEIRTRYQLLLSSIELKEVKERLNESVYRGIDHAVNSTHKSSFTKLFSNIWHKLCNIGRKNGNKIHINPLEFRKNPVHIIHQATIDSKDAEKQAIQSELATASKKLAEQAQQLEAKQKELELAQAQIAQQHLIATQKAPIAVQSPIELGTVEAKVKTLEQQLAEAQAARIAAEQQIKIQAEAQATQITAEQQAKLQAEAKVKTLEQQLAEAQTAQQQLISAKNPLEKELLTAKAQADVQVKTLEQQLAEAKAQVGTQAAQAKALEQQMAQSLATQSAAEQQTKLQAETKIKELTQQLAAIQGQVGDKNAQAIAQQQTVEQQAQEIASLKAKLTELETIKQQLAEAQTKVVAEISEPEQTFAPPPPPPPPPGPPPLGGPGGSSSFCFIAHNVYANELDKWKIIELRKYRDTHMITNVLGKNAVQLYYMFSPEFIKYLDRHPENKQPLKVLLDIMVSKIVDPSN